ncbi:DNA-binding protein RFX6-like isoform X1 [Acropora millepora]|uniref:DNA-binding protein RFX6-like isoform X1 n=2 Tax=Acropora millepora TaxID=45264 RepID=UPI001CF426C7|nr:DNA-binding protein RFX6-like isoform X1 [Acropora millepora]
MEPETIEEETLEIMTHEDRPSGRPKRVRARKSYCEVETDEECNPEELKQLKAKGGRRKESYSCIMLEKKQKQIAQTLIWLSENYELKDGMCLPRCVMYTHYLDFCRKGKLCPAGPATFGKIIRQRFPKLTTRRLGTRGQSKYHYYGIVVKETSAYFHAGYSKKGLTRFSGMKGKGDANGNHKKFSLSSKSGTLLPEFPNAANVHLPEGVSMHKVETFIMMYRTHCQRMLDTVVSANFEGVQNFITHFWQGMPSHIISVLECPVVVDIVAICDSISYKVLTDVLIPSAIQDLPESLRDEITDFADNLLDWLDESLTNVPQSLKEAKLEVARAFTQALKRQVCFVHLAQAARSALLSYEDVSQMLGDLTKIDFDQILSKSVFISGNSEVVHKAKTYVEELESLLRKQAPLEAYIEWLDSVVDRCVIKETEEYVATCFEDRSRKFLAMWSFITACVLADLTLRSSPSFGVFHLLHTAFEEYVFLVVENQKMLEMDKRLNNSLEIQMKKEFRTLIPSIETETNKPKENQQMEHVSRQEKETVRPKRRKTNINPESSPNEKVFEQFKPRFHENTYPDAAQYINACTPQAVTIPSCESYQTAPLNSPPSHQFAQPISLCTTADSQYPPMENRSSFSSFQISGAQQPARDFGATVPDVNSFQGDFINAIDKAIFSSKLSFNINLEEYMGNSWVQTENPNFPVLNSVNVQQHNSGVNGAMNFPRNGHFPVTYENSIHPNAYSSSYSAPTNSGPQQTPYLSSNKDDYASVQNITNMYPRYNVPNYFYDSMRNFSQPAGSDILNGVLSAPASSYGMDGLPLHDVQLNRLGVGAV